MKIFFFHLTFSQVLATVIKMLLCSILYFEMSLVYLLGGETADHVNFMQHMLVSYSLCYF